MHCILVKDDNLRLIFAELLYFFDFEGFMVSVIYVAFVATFAYQADVKSIVPSKLAFHALMMVCNWK